MKLYPQELPARGFSFRYSQDISKRAYENFLSMIRVLNPDYVKRKIFAEDFESFKRYKYFWIDTTVYKQLWVSVDNNSQTYPLVTFKEAFIAFNNLMKYPITYDEVMSILGQEYEPRFEETSSLLPKPIEIDIVDKCSYFPKVEEVYYV
jgi:hypothetical protein